ncbi:uncharacterized protein GLRG_05576 [Colletotrichum graminicola M1.001]|uniref:Zn(2)-C6 fungal-type domain-containing protein n=1 Tax=Colletotrichum graminicola (strain M1.001 / M2 / FGSC 10212) TaxID=645133 RepID=E3QHU4_COLGM|nr:uncharacterized protein GLRG_05576 [Colletotrichum graminicola M1.001]EFQ30432.1 hypothetical protein GLRG_05576 [Colletotrichum graminicola M1.001]
MKTENIPLGDDPSAKPSSAGLKRKRRPRAPIACGTCRARKLKCDGNSPCSNCVRHEFSCSYGEAQNETPRQGTPSYGSLVRIQQPLQPHPMPQQFQPVCQPQSMPQPRVFLPECLHPSPASSDDPIKHEPSTYLSLQEHGHRERGSTPSSEQEVDGLGQVNEHTEGAEFYGPTGTFYFLARLRSRANTQKQPEVGVKRSQSSIVNLLHSSDYSTPPDSRVLGQSPYGKGSPQSTVARRESLQQGVFGGAEALLSAADASLATDMERECARLYFQNLHNIHPILEQTAFLQRCEDEIWSRPLRPDILMCSQMRREARFLALYNVVVAIGAITAGEASLLMEDHTREFLDRTRQQPGEDDSLYPPIRLARRFFERSRLHLEDICESSSLETAQTLFLMSVFGQNALKPHSCYMYSGMAIRTASAMGIPNNIRSETSPESLLWWTQHFPNSACCLINPMVDLAKILMWMTDNLSVHSNHMSLQRLSQTALSLDRDLDDWRSGLPRQLRFDMSSLEDSEFAMKQKTVLKLRFLNARILLHRQFIIAKSLEADRNTISRHVTSCVKAATETIKFMHTSYLHRPYFRTWWYNCMYLLDACMVLLHVLISNICPIPADEVMENIELSLDIFKSMKMLAVARRCADIVKELLHVGARTHSGPQQRCGSAAAEAGPVTKAPDGSEGDGDGGGGGGLAAYATPAFTSSEGAGFPVGAVEFGDALMIPGDLDANLVDPNVVWNFLNFEHWNAWSDAGFK